MKDRGDPAQTQAIFCGTEAAEELGHQVLDQLAAADQQLEPDQAGELAKLALASIPERP